MAARLEGLDICATLGWLVDRDIVPAAPPVPALARFMSAMLGGTYSFGASPFSEPASLAVAGVLLFLKWPAQTGLNRTIEAKR